MERYTGREWEDGGGRWHVRLSEKKKREVVEMVCGLRVLVSMGSCTSDCPGWYRACRLRQPRL